MIYFGLLQAAPAISTPTSVGFQIESTALSYLQDNQVEKIEFYAACINKNNAYVKHSVSISSDTESKRVELPVCTETGVNMDRQFGLPAYGTVVNAYVLVYGQKLKVLECKLVDDFGGTLTIQECSSEPNYTYIALFSPEAQEFLNQYADKSLIVKVKCRIFNSSEFSEMAIPLTDISKEVEVLEVCSEHGGLLSSDMNPILGDLGLDNYSDQFIEFGQFSYQDTTDLETEMAVNCHSRKVPNHVHYYYNCFV